MNKFKERIKNYPIKRKLIAIVGSITVLAVVVAVIILIGMQYITTNVKGIYEGPMNNMSDVNDVKYGLTDLQRAINRLLAEGGENLAERYATFEKTVEEDVNLVVSAVASLEKNFKTAEGRNKLAQLKAEIDEGENVRPQVMELLKSGKIEEAYSINYETYLPIV